MNFLFIMIWFWNRHKKEKPDKKKTWRQIFQTALDIKHANHIFFVFLSRILDKTNIRQNETCQMRHVYILYLRLKTFRQFLKLRISIRNHSFIIKIVRSYQNNNYPSSQNISEWFCVRFYRCRSSICKKLGTLDVHIHSSPNEVFKNKMFNRLRLSP